MERPDRRSTRLTKKKLEEFERASRFPRIRFFAVQTALSPYDDNPISSCNSNASEKGANRGENCKTIHVSDKFVRCVYSKKEMVFQVKQLVGVESL